MLEYTRRTEPIEKPGRLQLAILEWQRILVDKARMAHDEGESNRNGGGRRASPDGLGSVGPRSASFAARRDT
jgi:hypothetical protein